MSRKTNTRGVRIDSFARGAYALGLAALFLTACSQDVATLGLGERTNRFRLTVSITNVGDGFGRAEVIFSAGAAQNQCTQVLGPGQTCAPFVQASVRPETAMINVFAETGSVFVGWTGSHCSGTSGECTVENTAGDFDNEFDLEPRFDLAP